jgi:hypothetical protein
MLVANLAISVRRSRLGLCLLLSAIADPVAGLANEAGLSSIMVPVTVPFDTLQRSLDAAVPRREAGQRQVQVAREVPRGATLSWNFQRAGITLTGDSGGLRAGTTIRGQARIQGTAVLIRGDIGRLLGKINPSTIPFSAHADIVATTGLHIVPRLRPDWRLDARVDPQITLHEASIPILNLTRASVRGQLQPELDRQARKFADDLRAHLRRDPFLENAAREVWEDLCKAHPLPAPQTDVERAEADDEANQPLWLIVEPVTAHAGQPRISPDAVTLPVGLSARLRLSDRAEEPDCPPLPALSLDALDPGVSITLPVRASYERLARELQPLVIGQSLEIGSTGIMLTPVGVDVAAGDEGRVRVVVDAEVALPGFWQSVLQLLRGPRQVQVALEARPHLDTEAQVLTFTRTEITATSGNWASIMGLAVELAQSRLVATFEQTARLDLAAEAARARSEADRSIDAARQNGLGGLELSEARLTRLMLDAVAAGPDGVELIAVADGDLAVSLPDLRMD